MNNRFILGVKMGRSLVYDGRGVAADPIIT